MVEIIKALTLIKDICNQHKVHCNSCPFYDVDDSGCYLLHHSPAGWNIKTKEDVSYVFNKRK